MSAPLPRLYAIADLQFAGNEETWLRWLNRLGHATSIGELSAPVAIQVRARQLAGRHFAAAAERARTALGDASLTVLNGPPALAARLGYHGAHWPESEVPEAPLENPTLTFLSAAVHSRLRGASPSRSPAEGSTAAVSHAEQAGANALVFAPVFEPSWKSSRAAGLATLEAVTTTTHLPVYALGGVTVERARDCLHHGAYGIAVVSGVFGENDLAAAAERYLSATHV